MSNPDASQKNSWRRYLFDRTPNIFRRFYGVRYMGTLGLLMDSVSQGVTDAVYSPYIESNLHSLDALEPVGNEIGIPSVAADSPVTHRNRCRGSWDTWAHAGTAQTIESQVAATTGYDVSVSRDSSFGSWSDFIVDVAINTHPVTDAGPELGTFVLGRPVPGSPANPATNPQTYLGPRSLSADVNYSLRRLILHWKPSRYRCTFVRFTLPDSSTYKMPVQA